MLLWLNLGLRCCCLLLALLLCCAVSYILAGVGVGAVRILLLVPLASVLVVDARCRIKARAGLREGAIVICVALQPV